jgi:hypothetical protein
LEAFKQKYPAGHYLKLAEAEISKIKDQTTLQPLPEIACKKESLGQAIGPAIPPGGTVRCGWLDEPLRWLKTYSKPQLSQQGSPAKWTAMLMLKVDERGHVVDVAARGGSNLYGAESIFKTAGSQWQTNLPTYQGKPVKTYVPLDIDYSQ